jgi:hypothetical protein
VSRDSGRDGYVRAGPAAGNRDGRRSDRRRPGRAARATGNPRGIHLFPGRAGRRAFRRRGRRGHGGRTPSPARPGRVRRVRGRPGRGHRGDPGEVSPGARHCGRNGLVEERRKVFRRFRGGLGAQSRAVRHGSVDPGVERPGVRRRGPADPGPGNRAQDGLGRVRGSWARDRRVDPEGLNRGVRHCGRNDCGARPAGPRRGPEALAPEIRPRAGRRPGPGHRARGTPGPAHRAGPVAVSHDQGHQGHLDRWDPKAGEDRRTGRPAAARDRPKDPGAGRATARKPLPERNPGYQTGRTAARPGGSCDAGRTGRGARRGKGPGRDGRPGTGRLRPGPDHRAESPAGPGCRGRRGRGSAARRCRARGTRPGANPGEGRSSGHPLPGVNGSAAGRPDEGHRAAPSRAG